MAAITTTITLDRLNVRHLAKSAAEIDANADKVLLEVEEVARTILGSKRMRANDDVADDVRASSIINLHKVAFRRIGEGRLRSLEEDVGRRNEPVPDGQEPISIYQRLEFLEGKVAPLRSDLGDIKRSLTLQSLNLHRKNFNSLAAPGTSLKLLASGAPGDIEPERLPIRSPLAGHLVPDSASFTTATVLTGGYFTNQKLNDLSLFYAVQFAGGTVPERRMSMLRFFGVDV